MPTEPTRGKLTVLADLAERLAIHLERLGRLDGQLADLGPVISFDPRFNSDAPDLAADVCGWPGGVAEALATARTVLDECVSKQACGQVVATERVAELWGAVDVIREAVGRNTGAEVWLKPSEINRRFCGASPATIARMRGKIRNRRTGNAYVYLEADIERLFPRRP